MNKINQRGISLIVLIITVIVLSILATVVIINISNTNIFTEAKEATSKYNKKQLESAMQIEKANMLLENGGKSPNMFALIEKLVEKNIITNEQKIELIENGGELNINGETIKLDVDSTLYCHNTELVTVDDTYAIRWSFTVNKKDNFEVTEIGYLLFPFVWFETFAPELSIEEKFKLGAAEKYDVAIAENEATKYDEESDDWLKYSVRLTGIEENQTEVKYSARGYVKYTYNGVEGVLYSDVITVSASDLK